MTLQAPKAAAELMGSLMRGAATPQAAQELLKSLGVWAPHEHLAPLRAGLTNNFGTKLQVCPLNSSNWRGKPSEQGFGYAQHQLGRDGCSLCFGARLSGLTLQVKSIGLNNWRGSWQR